MILGLPWTTWLLLLAAVGGGLAIELSFYHRERGRTPGPRSSEPGEHS